jgi:hypothetical protein
MKIWVVIEHDMDRKQQVVEMAKLDQAMAEVAASVKLVSEPANKHPLFLLFFIKTI